MFSGMMFCADCGSVMYQCRATNFRREQEYYLCAGYRKFFKHVAPYMDFMKQELMNQRPPANIMEALKK